MAPISTLLLRNKVGIFLNTKHKRRQPRQAPNFSLWIEKWFTDRWGGELASWFFAALSIIAILITLSIHDGRSLPDWPFRITLNTLVSIFATIGEMAMMKSVTECISQLKWLWFTRRQPLQQFQDFDEASHGRMGSLKLFWKLRGIHLVCVGAAITVVALTFGSFTQQMLTFPSRLRIVGVATVPQVLRCTASDNIPLNANIFSAVYDGLANDNANLSTVPTNSNTRNCTWNQHPSMGICASISDISKYLVQNLCNITEYMGPGKSDVTCFNYTLSNSNITFTGLNGINGLTTQLSEVQMQTIDEGYGQIANTIADFYLLHQPIIAAGSVRPMALECKLQFCSHTYNTTVYSGSTTTFVTSTELHNFSTLTPGGEDPSDPWDSLVVYDWIKQIFTGSCFMSDYIDNPEWGISCDTAGAQAFGVAAGSQLSGLVPDVKYAVEGILNNTAITIINALREGAGGFGSTRLVNGTAFAIESYIHAEYIWATLPVGLVLLTLIFLLATISQSNKAKTKIWKSSGLPVLQGLDHILHGELGGMFTINDVENLVRGLEVRLVMKEDKSWSLVRS